MATMSNNSVTPSGRATHFTIRPSILYFGTPVLLVSTLNPDSTPNLAPMSSAWALGYTIVLGLGRHGRTAANLERERECVLNLPSPDMWENVERLAPLTGENPVPVDKADAFRYEPRKFEASGLTPERSEVVKPPRVKECPIQLEATVVAMHSSTSQTFVIVETDVQRVHAHRDIVKHGSSHIDPERWSPLLYVFRHYVAGGARLGKTFRAEA
ncbi:MAG: flavin reductase family protein [Pseudolysinimonas sp.]